MQLAGKQVLNASPSKLWDILMNAETLAKIVPGVSSLEKTGENSYKSTLAVKLGPVSGSFNGNLQMEDIQQPKTFVLKVQQNSKIGNANAGIQIDLLPVEEDKTELSFNGDVKLSGLLAGLGQRVLGGVAGTLTKQFFENIEKELAKP
jgi:carbon monoxide dehydrogenase subunit G